MSLITDYGQNEDFNADDPGNVLRARLTKTMPTLPPDMEGRITELVYTAQERGLIENGVSAQDAVTIGKLFSIALNATVEDRQKMRM